MASDYWCNTQASRWPCLAPSSSRSRAARHCTPTWVTSAASRCSVAWLVLVWPALLLNYFGQGALVLRDGAAATNPFYLLAPQAALPLLVILSTAASVIASQAVISGAFSLTREAVQLDLLPRVRIMQTSEETKGQIYVPAANGFLFVCVCLFVLAFQSSAALTSAYGVAVLGTMICTTVLGVLVARSMWKWSWWRVAPLFGLFAVFEMAFLAGNMTKIPTGGWVPLAFAMVMFSMFVTWRDGRQRLRSELEARAVSEKKLPEMLAKTTQGARHRGVPGEPVGLRAHGSAAQSGTQQGAPRADRHPAHRDPARAARRPAGARALRGALSGRVDCAPASASWRRRTWARPCATRAARA